MAKPQRRAVSLLRGEVRPQKRFCPLQTCSPHSKPSQPPLGAWRAGRVHPHLFSVWQLGDALSFPRYSPSFRRRRAACVGTQSILPCSVRTCRGFTATGEVRPQKRFCPLQTCSPHSKPSQPPLGAWRAGQVHPHLFSVWQLGDALSFPRYSTSFRRRRVWGISVWGISPPPRRGSTDGSKQRLQGFCSTAIAFLPPTERSDRGNTAVGHRTRVLQPKGDGGLRPILDLRHFNFPSTKGNSRCWW